MAAVLWPLLNTCSPLVPVLALHAQRRAQPESALEDSQSGCNQTDPANMLWGRGTLELDPIR